MSLKGIKKSDGTVEYIYADDTLSEENAPGEAKAAGDRIAGVEGRITTLETAAPEIISNATKDWLDDNVTPTGSAVAIDSSLTQSGLAADAKAAGDAVNDLKSDLGVKVVLEQLSVGSYQDSMYWNIENSTAVLTTASGSNWRAFNAIAVVEGQTFKVISNQGGTNKTRTWVVTDDSFNVIAMAGNHYNEGLVEETFTVPSGGSLLLITTTTTGATGEYATKPYAFLWLNVRKNNATAEVQSLDFAVEQKYFWNIETSKAIWTSMNSTWIASTEIPVKEGEIYRVKGVQGATHKARVWTITDDELNIIRKAPDGYRYSVGSGHSYFIDGFVKIPSGGTKLLLTSKSDSDVWGATVPHAYLWKITNYSDSTAEKPLQGLKLSLLGDSISAFAGTIPAGNTAYYSGSNSGVYSAYQMWWSVLCQKTGMIPCVINGWSGSGITQLEDSDHSSITPMSSDSRCLALHDATNGTPDIILIAGGVNDYTYAQSAQSEPSGWDGKTTPVFGSAFDQTYAVMIKKIQTAYPKAQVVALSTWFTMRGTDNGYTLTHTVGQNVWTQADYNNAIKKVAEQMHIPYIDVSDIGINRANMYPNYAQDSSTIPTHPNSVGQYVMGSAVAKKIVPLVKAFLT